MLDGAGWRAGAIYTVACAHCGARASGVRRGAIRLVARITTMLFGLSGIGGSCPAVGVVFCEGAIAHVAARVVFLGLTTSPTCWQATLGMDRL